nr:immunoglobulin light chain junction region [Macaca mulatta]MOX56901.1 immunoglobulin light chain junction region [Macaca mulatta]
CLQTKNSIFTF